MEDASRKLRITVLGSVRAYHGDQEIALGPPRQRAVFAYLALHAGEPVGSEALSSAIWGGRPPRRVEELIRTYIARLRCALEPDTPPRFRTNVIASVSGGYRLKADADRVDAVRFGRLAATARVLAEAEDESRAFECYGQAMQLWRDPLLTELGVGLWPDSREVESLRRDWLVAGLAYTTIGLRLGQAAVVLPHAERMAAAEPLEEAVQAAYFSALVHTGQRAAALHHYDQVRARLRTELGVEPGPELATVYDSFLHEQPATSAPPVPGAAGLARSPWFGPGPTVGPLVGRRLEVGTIADSLATNRLLTVVGPPGCGKSAVGLAVAERVQGAFPAGVVVLELAETTNRAALSACLAETVGGPASADPVQVLGDGPRLLVLDNVEHLADTVAAVVHDVVRGCRAVSVLVTSRQPLALPGEAVRRIGPLPLPAADGLSVVEDNAGVRFFVQRAAQVCPGFQLRATNAAAVAWICHQLDGLPLALELAAACLYTDSLTELLRRVADPLHRLHPHRRGYPVHHRSLYLALRRSVDCLGPRERRLLLLLGTGPREFTLDEVRRRWAATATDSTDAVPGLLDRLTSQSLLARRTGPRGVRYQMLRLVHRMAATQAAERHAAGDRRARPLSGGTGHQL
ncbi:AfsR/SARP family transcriptional regulator [Micromonospora sp. WMMA1923]|uniref:AfsR/SARP family transcriptional regulator n=1 Tax=Micromonospora sp. WMMA1923 TaxID=3404125 RepID=UPI003B946AC5